jgi:protein-L-isoaspartate O-methyltransferase
MNKDPSKTVEPQYQEILERQKEKGLARFGLMSSQVYFDDPKRLAFLLSRYKFVSKMLEGKSRVLEIGCADAFGTPIVAKAVKQLVAIDMDPLFIADARKKNRFGAWHRIPDARHAFWANQPNKLVFGCLCLRCS